MANIYDMADTWNDGGTTFTAIKMNVTDGAGGAPVAASDSLLMDLQVDGTSKFSVDKDGDVTTGARVRSSGGDLILGTGSSDAFRINGTDIRVGPKISFGSNAVAGPDTILVRDDAANTLALRNSTNAQTFNIYNPMRVTMSGLKQNIPQTLLKLFRPLLVLERSARWIWA